MSLTSQPPAPTPSKSSDPKQSHSKATEQKSAQDKRGTEEQPLVIKSVSSPEAAQEREEKRAEREEESSDNWWSRLWAGVAAIAAIATAVIAGIAASFALRTLNTIEKQTDATLVQVKHLAASERAYVKLSTFSPGISFHEDKWACSAAMRLKNHGRTPAKVTSITLSFIVTELGSLPLPPSIPQLPLNKFRAYLVSNEEISFPEVKIINEEAYKAIRHGTKRLYLVGYVDYIDQFGSKDGGDRHRTGFAIQYMEGLDDPKMYPTIDSFNSRNNSFVLTEPGYNYDRPRKPSEGLDWMWTDQDI